MEKRKDYTGKKFGKLEIVQRAPDKINKQGEKYKYWKCRCECGRNDNFLAYESNLILGKTWQCNICRNEQRSQSLKKINKYILDNNYGIGITHNTNKEFYFDLEDYDKIKQYCWRENSTGYIISTTPKGIVYLHRLVLGLPTKVEKDGLLGDHIKSRRYDNRKSQLRICKQEDNNLNLGIRKDNNSGVRGVTWEEDRKKWKATLRYRNKQVLLKRFDNIEEAISARKDAELKYLGDYSRYIEDDD